MGIIITIRMVGAAWTIDTLGDGWDNDTDTSATWAFAAGTAYDSFWTNVGELDPCSLLVPAFWLENVGGIMLDVMIRADITPYWTWHPDSFTCEGIRVMAADDVAGLAATVMIADGIPFDFQPTTAYLNSNCIPSTWWREVDFSTFFPTTVWLRYPFVHSTGTNFIAQDPSAAPMLDGAYRRDNDQMELYLYVLSPPMPVSVEPQSVRFWVKAKIAD